MSLFTEVIAKIPKLNGFNLSYETLYTVEFGQLVPILCKEVLPRDKFRMSTEVVVKTSPFLAPIFSRIDLYLHYFFVPVRLLHSDWEDFITTGTDGLSTDLTPPYCKLSDLVGHEVKDGSLDDYLNMPAVTGSDVITAGIGNLPVNILKYLCYQKIYSDWFKDELLDSFEFEPIAGGELTSAQRTMIKTLRYRSWKKDYFTSARPSTQLGASIPIPITGEIVSDGDFRFKNYPLGVNTTDYLGADTILENIDGSNYSTTRIRAFDGTNKASLAYGDGLSLDSAGIDVNDLRRALKLQQWQERNMRGGNRYIENIYHHFGVKSSDARLQRSELLGGRKVPVVVSEVTQTSAFMTDAATEPTTPLGQIAGKGQSVANSGRIKWSAEEHGFIMCIASIMPKAAYMQGLPREFWRMSYLDYAWPLFGNLGEQEVYNGEIFLPQAAAASAFGYQSRYAEYKFSPNEIHGAFRHSMAFWHNARIFDNAPQLNNDFVQLNGGQDDSTNKGQNRIFAYQPDGYGHFQLHIYHDIRSLRALPKYGIPSI